MRNAIVKSENTGRRYQRGLYRQQQKELEAAGLARPKRIKKGNGQKKGRSREQKTSTSSKFPSEQDRILAEALKRGKNGRLTPLEKEKFPIRKSKKERVPTQTPTLQQLREITLSQKKPFFEEPRLIEGL